MPKVKSIRCEEFKRFSDLTITGIPAEARLIVLIGPNGCGKTSVFEALNVWNQTRTGSGSIPEIYHKNGKARVNVDFHDVPSDDRQIFYFRSIHRHSPKIYRPTTSDVPPDFESVGSLTFKEDIENRVTVNIQKMINMAISTLYAARVKDFETPGMGI